MTDNPNRSDRETYIAAMTAELVKLGWEEPKLGYARGLIADYAAGSFNSESPADAAIAFDAYINHDRDVTDADLYEADEATRAAFDQAQSSVGVGVYMIEFYRRYQTKRFAPRFVLRFPFVRWFEMTERDEYRDRIMHAGANDAEREAFAKDCVRALEAQEPGPFVYKIRKTL